MQFLIKFGISFYRSDSSAKLIFNAEKEIKSLSNPTLTQVNSKWSIIEE
jgi:hypothetical protein